MKTQIVLFSIVAVAISGVTMAQEPSAQKDLDHLQGRWTASITLGTRKTQIVLDFKGDLVSTTMGHYDPEKPDTQQQVKLGVIGRFKTIDFVNGVNVGAEPNSLKDKIKPPDSLSLYELDGDTLKICSAPLDGKRPLSFAQSKGILITTYTRGSTPAKEAEPLPPGSLMLKGATITLVDKNSAILRGIDGKTHHVVIGKMEKAFDSNKQPIEPPTKIFKLGNVLDVTIVKGGARGNVLEIREASLVRGDLEIPAVANPSAAAKRIKTIFAFAEGPGEEFKGAVITKVEFTAEPYRALIDVNGRVVEIGLTNHNTLAYDLDGKKLAPRQTSKVLREGNKVDITLEPRSQDGPLPRIKEIHLIEGKLIKFPLYRDGPGQ